MGNVYLLPVQGKDPLERVWIPGSRTLDGLKAEVKPSYTGSVAAQRRAEELGLTPVVRMVGGLSADGDLWINWVKPGEKPRGFIELAAEEAAADATFGPFVRMLQARLTER